MRATLRTTTLAAALAATALLGAAGCSDDEPTDRAGTTTTAAAPDDTTGTGGGEETDQTAPAGANGIKVAADGTLWIAVLEGDEILHVDPESGRILHRYDTPEGSGPDDLVLDDDGIVYWTGFRSGVVGSLDPATGEVTVLATVGEGANPIARRSDGTLIVGRAVTATGLFGLDPTTEGEPVALGDPGNVNSFDVADDGVLYGPLTGATGGGAVVAVDAETGEVLRTVAELPGIPVALRLHEGRAYVALLRGTAAIATVDLETGAVQVLTPLEAGIVDNLAVGEDGTIYVTGFDEATVTVISPDGVIERTVAIGS